MQHVSDADLITSVRNGAIGAYGELYRRHAPAALAHARKLGWCDADDMVSEAFIKVLQVLLRGNGPDSRFRAYLFTTLRHLGYDRVRRELTMRPWPDMTPLVAAVTPADVATREDEYRRVAAAFGRLSRRWQRVLWLTEIGRQSMADTAKAMGTNTSALHALVSRARIGLRKAYHQVSVNCSSPTSVR